MKVGKPISKRTPTRLRHKIQKASTQKQRKQRKEAKKNPQWRSRLKKDPGVPNLFPYKAKVLAELEEGKRRKEEEQMAKREQAKARREGKAVTDVVGANAAALENGEVDDDMGEDDEDDDEVMDEGSSNPMAALLASAQARAQTYPEEDDDDEDDDSEDDEEIGEWSGIKDENATAPNAQPSKKVVPQQALADPPKAISALMDRMQKTTDGVQRMVEHYQIPPLATANSDAATRFLVEVARKRGRLGRGGVPNLHSAAMLVLNDVNENRLQLPAVQQAKKSNVGGKGDVTIVQTMAAPFQLEGLWGDEKAKNKDADVAQEMVVES